MIANARMYAVSREVAELWRALMQAIIGKSGLGIQYIDHAEPVPIEELWRRTDHGAVFMCGLPFSLARPQPLLIAAPVPSAAEYGGEARYWSNFVVRRDSRYHSIEDTFGGRIAFTVPGSQSGCVAALSYFMSVDRQTPLYAAIVAPTITPLGALSAVIDGAADVAPIDSYAFSLLLAHRPELTSRIRIVERTMPTPIPPVVASSSSVEGLAAIFLEAHQDHATRPMMETLLLDRFVRPPVASYDILRDRYESARRFWSTRPLAVETHPAFTL